MSEEHRLVCLVDSGEHRHAPGPLPLSSEPSARHEALIRNRRTPSDYSPARYHILSAMKMRVIGPGPLPRAPKLAAARCDKLLDIVWDPPASERLVLNLLPALQRSIEAERTAGTPLSEMVRTRRFAERVRREVLGVTPR